MSKIFASLIVRVDLEEHGTGRDFQARGYYQFSILYFDLYVSAGIACDTESYIYLPLLEETGYVPETKYATGNEIRLYADLLADKWNLRDKALFGANITSVVWDAKASKWTSTMTQEDISVNKIERKIRSDFVFLTTGLFDHPKLPRIPGLEDFRGASFHTSRWDYSITGGSPSDPSLSLLKDKRVGVIGTGATAVQAVPHLAKWAKELFVFQRTPASVDIRNNRATDPVEWSDKIAATKGWQRERRANFDACMCPGVSPHTGMDLVSDAFSHLNASAQLGSPFQVTNDNIGEYLDKIHTIDMPRQARLRARVAEIVRDKKTAEALTNWYPSWCKRPGVHDDYLQSFNLSSVHLVDTDGKGVDRITETGVVAGGGEEIPLDVLVFSTGYGLVVGGGRDAIFSFDTVGRAGRSLEDKFLQGGTSTLHGVMSHDFPNLFWLGPWQSGVSANYTTTLDNLTKHIAFIVSQAIKKKGENCLIETTVEAEEAWTGRVLQSALAFAGMAGCTPNYMNREGDMDRISKPADQLKAAKGALWGLGIGDYVRTIEDWEANGRLEGLEVTSIA